MRRPLSDRAVSAGLRPFAVLAAALPVAIGAFVLAQAGPALVATGGFRLFTDARWIPTADAWGLLPMVAATLVSSAMAVLLAAPVAIAFGLYANLYASPSAAGACRLGVGILAGVPSVVFGFVALTALVPLLVFSHPPGLGLGITAFTLAAMILPTSAAATDAAIRQVDPVRIHAVRALGLGQWDAARAVVLPSAAPGIRTAQLLAAGRALGETMAVMMVAGNTIAWPDGLFAPIRTLTATIAGEMAYATGVHRSGLFAVGLVLLAMVATLVALEPRR